MSEEVQERVEDYLALDQYIEQLHLQDSARLPANLAPQQRHIYGMAMFFHAASARTVDPFPEFREQLRLSLLAQMRDDNDRQGAIRPESSLVPPPTVPVQGQKQFRSIYRNEQVSQPTQLPSSSPESTGGEKTRHTGKRRIPFSRRTLFAGGTVAAASLLGAAAIGGAIEHALDQSPPDSNPGLPGDIWHPVTTVKQLGTDPVLFTTNTINGYLIRQTENTSGEQIVAFSAACTHLGCTVQWQKETRQFPCPCHGRIFDTAGGPVNPPNSLHHNTWLPRLETKTEADGTIYVKVPLPRTHRNGTSK
jgi:Rieske Fe-S protein